jgi:pyruvate/2-oxoglutarate dehydrogenase complex dihydrolipoamide acyltransferase (E2) component
MSQKRESYTVEPFPPMRRLMLDAGYLGRRKHIIHGLIEVDVTDARRAIREHEARTGENLSLTAFIVVCLAKAVEADRRVQAYRAWRNRLIIFDDVNVNVLIEAEWQGRKIVVPRIIAAANRRTLKEAHEEIRSAQTHPRSSVEAKFMRWFLRLPAFARRLFYWTTLNFPQYFREQTSPVMVSAVGMFGSGGGWGIPMPTFTLTVTLGGIAVKPGVVDGRIEIREYLDVTLSFDHDVIDGAPAARFTQRFRELIETGYGLIETHPTQEANHA